MNTEKALIRYMQKVLLDFQDTRDLLKIVRRLHAKDLQILRKRYTAIENAMQNKVR
jgi:hypothetical protein